MSGDGVYYYKNGDIYKGSFFHNHMNGKGQKILKNKGD